MINFFAPVESLMPEVEARMRSQTKGHHPDLAAALEHLLSSGGKRIRPAVALLTGNMLGGEQERLITLAASIEMLHTGTLVHDDLIDGALLRRGIATLNSQWSPAATVLTGDFIFARAAKLAGDTESVGVMQRFAETLGIIVSGELTQMFNSRGVASRPDYYARIYAKTASLFELSTTAAAMLSPVGPETVEELKKFGYEIGIAFQIVDDVLDFSGEETKVGKPLASDLRQGLITLPALVYFEGAPDDPVMQTIISGKRPGNADLDRLINSIRSSGAVEQAMQEAIHYVDRGLETLNTMPEGRERQALTELAHYITRREL